MHWEIEDIIGKSVIINAGISNDKKFLQWDFMLGSPFDLCAVFFWDGKMTLQDYQNKEIRPILFHKGLQMSKSVQFDDKTYGYSLYPARIRRETLYIGSKCSNVIVLEGDQKKISVEYKMPIKRTCFCGSQLRAVDSFQLKVNRSCNRIYYRIQKGSTLSEPVYEVSADLDFQIYLEHAWTVHFYSDKECSKEIT